MHIQRDDIEEKLIVGVFSKQNKSFEKNEQRNLTKYSFARKRLVYA